MSYTNTPCQLSIENLEDRMMLSTVQIFAAGQTGDEILQLKINDEVRWEYQNVGGDIDADILDIYTYQTNETLTPDQIRLEFINDAYDAATGYDRNVFIDKIVIDGVTYETESSSTYSTGVWDNGLTGPGFLETETLNINGSFFYGDQGDGTGGTDELRTILEVVASGQAGGEIFNVLIDDQQVAQFTATTTETTFEIFSDQELEIDQIKIQFVNDYFDPAAGIDLNLDVTEVRLQDIPTGAVESFSFDSSNVFSTGTYTSEDGVVDGFGRGGTLHTNGFLQYTTPDPQAGSRPLAEVLDEFNNDFPGFFPFYADDVFVDNSGNEFRIAGGLNGFFENILVVRVSDDGSNLADTSFGVNGLATPRLGEQVIPATTRLIADFERSNLISGVTDDPPETQIVRARPLAARLAFDSNNNIFIVMDVVADNTPRFAPGFNGVMVGTEIIKLDIDGNVDLSFGAEGRRFIPYQQGTTVLVNEVAFDANDQLFIRGPQVEPEYFLDPFAPSASVGVASVDTVLRLDGNSLVEDSSFSFPTT